MKDIVKSKILVNLVLLLPCAIIAGISLNIGTCQTMTQRIAAFLIPICFSFFVSCWGIFSNSKFLDFEWEDEVMIIKRGAAVMMGTFGGMMIAGGVALFAFLLTLVSYLLAVVASSILLIGLSYFYFRKVYNNPHLLDD